MKVMCRRRAERLSLRMGLQSVLFAIATGTILAVLLGRPAETQQFRAGFTRITVSASMLFDALITYPTDTAENDVTEGAFHFRATRDVPVASSRFPVILFSHGGGRGAGTPLIHRDLLLQLAHEGFIVIAAFHPAI